MRIKQILAGIALSATLVAMPVATFAQASSFGNKYLSQVGQKAEVSGLANANLMDVVARIVNVIISVLGIVLLGYLLYAGFLWMTAQGDDKQVTRAKDMIKNAIIGLVIVAVSFAISNFVLSRLNFITTGTAPTDTTGAKL